MRSSGVLTGIATLSRGIAGTRPGSRAGACFAAADVVGALSRKRAISRCEGGSESGALDEACWTIPAESRRASLCSTAPAATISCDAAWAPADGATGAPAPLLPPSGRSF